MKKSYTPLVFESQIFLKMLRVSLAVFLIEPCATVSAQSNIFPASGNVGIGTSDPLFALDLRGVLHMVNKDASFATWDNLRLWSSGTNSFIESNGDEEGLIIRSNLGNKILLQSNVGIGTSNPTEKLSVNGNIRAKEIKVETANWPDYVFTKKYTLPSLNLIEQHINNKGHLPGIPSAKEVEANGISLGEMNAKLLEKIEELTLHLIAQEKQAKVNKELIASQIRVSAEQQTLIDKLYSRLKKLETKSK